jgi:hypothetical protein
MATFFSAIDFTIRDLFTTILIYMIIGTLAILIVVMVNNNVTILLDMANTEINILRLFLMCYLGSSRFWSHNLPSLYYNDGNHKQNGYEIWSI